MKFRVFPDRSTIKWLMTLLLFMLAMVLYASSTPQGLLLGNGDWTELQRTSYRLGIARSTGYPVFTLMGFVVSHIGEALGQNPYTWVSYTSGVASALALVLCFWTLLRLTPLPIAFAGSLLLMVTNTLWQISTIPDVQGLNALAVVGMMWMMVLHLEQPRRFYPLAGMLFFAGLGLANHRTIVLMFPAAGIAVLVSNAWRRFMPFLGKGMKYHAPTSPPVGAQYIAPLRPQQWLILILAFVLPLLTYGYLYIRAADAHVAFSTRPTWFESDLTTQNITDLIIGRNQAGQGLTNFFHFPTDDLKERLILIREQLRADLTFAGIFLGIIGLMSLAVYRWRLGIVMAVYCLTWLGFLLGWRLEKGVLYQYPLVIALVMGLCVLARFISAGINQLLLGTIYRAPTNPYGVRRVPLVMTEEIDISRVGLRPAPTGSYFRSQYTTLLTALPILALGVYLYRDNQPVRDMSSNRDGDYYLSQMALLPQDTFFYTQPWSSEIFILLEYLDSAGREDVIPKYSGLWWYAVDDMKNPGLRVYAAPTMRSLLGLYDGATWFQEQTGLVFSGTESPLFLQAHPRSDPRLQAEADAATIVNQAITPEIELYSYTLNRDDTAMRLALYWHPLEATQQPYSVYAHLRVYEESCVFDTITQLLAQDDSFAPVRGAYPVRLWAADDIVKDTYIIPWAQADALPQGAALVAGMTLNGERQQEFCLPLNE